MVGGTYLVEREAAAVPAGELVGALHVLDPPVSTHTPGVPGVRRRLEPLEQLVRGVWVSGQVGG